MLQRSYSTRAEEFLNRDEELLISTQVTPQDIGELLDCGGRGTQHMIISSTRAAEFLEFC